MKSPLPSPATPLIGRAHALAELKGLLESARLVTVLGPAGMGKTRLAIALAAARRRGTNVFVDLTEQVDGDGVVRATSAALGIQRPDVDAVADAIARRPDALIVLDNFEQVATSAPDTVGAWLSACPEARFLVTSRERLRIAGENVFELPPLALPEGDADADAGAVALWRSRRADDGDRDDDLALVCEVVRRLDGIPLAIELAAARAPVLGLRELLSRLSSRFELLGRGDRGAPARQATLRGAIDWSWSLLSAPERTALAQCSVFRGGFTVTTAEAVLDLSDHADAPPVLDLLQSLRDKSLLRRSADASGTPRLGMFLSIRDYAADKLDDGGATARRAAAHFAAASRALVDAVDRPDGAVALRALVAEVDNLRAIVDRARAGDRDSVRAAVTALEGLDLVAWTRGPVGAHLEPLDRAVAMARDTDGCAAELARALEMRGLARGSLGEIERGLGDLERAVAICEDRDDRAALARTLASLAWIRLRAHDLEGNRALLERARTLAIECGDRHLEGIVVGSLGAAPKERGQFELAERLYRDALAIHREVGNRRFEGVAYTRLAILYLESNRFAELRAAAERALAIHRELESRYVEGIVLIALGAAHHAEGRLGEARAVYSEAIPLQQFVGEKRVHGATVGYLGLVLLELGEIEPALEHMASAHRLLEAAEEHRHAALFLGFHGGAEAALGHHDRARELLARADREHARQPDDKVATVLALMHALFDHDAAQAALDAAVRTGGGGEVPASRSIDVRIAVRMLERLVATGAGDALDAEDALLVHPRGAWFRAPGGDPVDCRRRHPIRRLLVKLAHQRVHRPGRALSTEELLEAGWPGEAMSPESGQNRLYVTLNRLRNLGLRGFLEATDGGYRLSPARAVGFARDDGNRAVSQE